MRRVAEDSSVAPVSTMRPAYMTAIAVGDLADDAEVVGDEDQAHAGLALEVGEQVHDLRLHGDVERGGRLVGDEDRRVERDAPWRS